MKISEELVRELQKRIDVSYEEAEATLKRTKGDVNMAIFLIMKRRNSGWERLKASFTDAFMKLLQYRLILTRKKKVLIDLPLLLIALIVLIDGTYDRFFPLFIIFITALVCECEVKIQKNDEAACKENEELKSNHQKAPANNKANVYSEQKPTEPSKPVVVAPVINEGKADDKNENKKQDNHDDDYFEIVVEE